MKPVTFAKVIACLLLLPYPVLGDGGDTCASPTGVTSVPFTDSGGTCGTPTGGGPSNSYDEHCPAHSTSPDVVYTLTPSSTSCIDVSLCGDTGFDSKLYVYASNAGGCRVSVHFRAFHCRSARLTTQSSTHGHISQ